MDALIRKIRNYAGMSQQELAAELGVTFATINRWENGHAYPNRMAQMRLYDMCAEKDIPLMSYIKQRFEDEANSIELPEGRRLLYHGSKSGIAGNVAPISRDRCDFGKGFYMGTDARQPLTLICDYEKSAFYMVSLDSTGMSSLTVPATIEWAMLVAYHRGKMEKIRGSSLYEKYSSMLKDYDIVTGYIADDRMFYVLDNFFLGNITDTALVKSLSALQLGMQVVCITQAACGRVRIEKEMPLSYLEKRCLIDESEKNRANGIALANDICKQYRRDGKYFDELLEEN